MAPSRRPAPPLRLAAARLAPLVAGLGLVAACGSSGPAAGGPGAAPAPAAAPASAPASIASAALADPARAGSTDWLTYHHDNSRSGLDPASPPLGRPHRAWASAPVHGQIYAEPLIAGDRVIVATEENWVYALSRRNGRVLWHRHVAPPVSASALPCGDIDPSGITGTPVIDAAAGRVYVVAFTAGGHRHELVALSLRSGAIRLRRTVDAPGADPLVHQERGALALSHGRVIIPYGGLFGDCGDYHGRVVSVTATRGAGLRSYRVPAGREAGIWAPSGPAVDPAGDIFVATGNGSSTSQPDHGNSVIRLSPDLGERGYFTTSGTVAESASDADLGSVGPSLLAGGRAFVAGKTGMGYLLDTTNLGGVGGQRGSTRVCGGAYGGLAVDAGLIYVPCTDGVHAVRVSGDRPAVAWTGPGFDAGPPIIAGGAAWTVDLDAGRLVALDRASGRQRFAAGIGRPNHFASVAASAGLVIAPGGNRVTAFSIR